MKTNTKTNHIKGNFNSLNGNGLSKHIIDQIPNPIFIKDIDGRFIACNKAFEEFSGIDYSELVGRTAFEVFPKELADYCLIKDTEIYQNKGHYISEYKLPLNGSNESKVVLINKAALHDENGKIIGLICIVTDITERKKEEIELLRFKRAVEQNPNSIVITDLNGNIVYVNPKFCELTGYTYEEAIGQNPRILKSGLQSKEFYAKLWSTILSGKEWNGEFLNKKKNGELYWEHASICPIFDFSGKIINFIATKVDITEKKKTLELLNQSEKIYKSIASAASDAIILIDSEQRILKWNKAATNIFGYQKNEVINKKLHNLLAPDEYREKANINFEKFKNTGKGKALNKLHTLKALRKSGTIIDIELTVSAIRLWNQWYAVGVIRDVTEKIQIKEKLERLKERYKAILAAVPDILIEIDTHKKIIWANKAGYEFFGDDIKGKAAEVIFESDQFFDEFTCSDHTHNNTENDLEKLYSRQDGVNRLLSWRFKTICDKNGYLNSVLCSARDITDFEEIKSQLAHAIKMESIGQLAAGIAHEINTPLQYISNGNYFIKYAVDTYEKFFNSLKNVEGYINHNGEKLKLQDYISSLSSDINFQEIHKELKDSVVRNGQGIEKVTNIVKSLKNFAHPSSGAKSYSNINEGINDTVVISRNEWKYVSDIKLNLEPSLPLVYCCLDEINQVLLNLIINSVHAIQEKFVNINKISGIIEISTYLRGNDIVVIDIKDNGIGIPEKNLPKIFDLFFTTKEVGKGTGQGLAIAYDIIKNKHQGNIHVWSVPGEGTKFTIELPINERMEKL